MINNSIIDMLKKIGLDISWKNTIAASLPYMSATTNIDAIHKIFIDIAIGKVAKSKDNFIYIVPFKT